MNKPYAEPITRRRPDMAGVEPSVRPGLLGPLGALSGPYLRLGLGIERVALRRPEVLVEAFRASLSGQKRIVLAFRHPYGDEPQLLSWTFRVGVEREARRLGSRLPMRPWAIFVHGYEVPRWGGALVRFLLPRVGALPVHHAKMDSAGMERIRRAIENGPYPLALAPEGQVSYASERLPRIEQGTARLALDAAAGLARMPGSPPVAIVPISVHYRYGRLALASLRRLVGRLERFSGVRPSGRGEPLVRRVTRCRDALLSLAEGRYGLSSAGGTRARLEAIIERAMEEGERLLGLRPGSADPIGRVYRMRQTGWDRIFVPGSRAGADRHGAAAALADRLAGESWYAMRHMELVDFAWYFASDDHELAEGAPFHRLAEYAQNVWDLANRLAGGAISGRRIVRPRRAVVIAAEPIDVSARLEGWRGGRRALAASLTADLESAYRRCIEESRSEP